MTPGPVQGPSGAPHERSARTATLPEDAGLRLERRGEVALLWIEPRGRAVPVLDAAMLEVLPGILDRLDADEGVVGAVLAGGTPGTFLAGADVESFLHYREPAEVVAEIHRGNALLERIERWRKPLVLAVDGACLGGGTELALAARYVLASSGPRTRFGLPEVRLGLLPGLGGMARLPERVGLLTALDLVLTGKSVYARAARRSGLAHATVPPEGLIDAALRVARELAAGVRVPRVPPRPWSKRVLEAPLARDLAFRRAVRTAHERTHGNYPAPDRIVEVLRVWAERGRDAALAASAEAFAALLFTPEARALIHLFFAQTAAKKNPWKDLARPVRKVAVLGAGAMGAGIAQVTAEAGVGVLLKDRDTTFALRGKGTVWQGVDGRVGKGLSAFERDRVVERVVAVGDYAALAQADLTIEAVFEDPAVKQEVLAEVERVTAPGHVFASNTSAIPIARIAERAARPEAVLGMHYFSPVPKMPLLEVVVTERTAEWAVATAVEVGRAQGKTVIVVGDGPGFYTTRTLGVYVAEAMLALRQGADPVDLEQAMVRFGFPLGPLAMLDDVGIDVGAKIQVVLADALRARGMEPDPASEALVAAGYVGRKAGRGFYRYDDGKRAPVVDPEAMRVAGFLTVAAAAGPVFADRLREPVESGPALAERLTLALVREAISCLEEGILRSASDGDLGAVFGFGFPPFRGGPFFLVDQRGAGTVVEGLRSLADRHGDRFTPPASLVRMAEEGGRYYA